MIREGIKNLIKHESDMKVVGETGNPLDIIDDVMKLKPDLIILDLSMPGRSGLDVLKDIKTLLPESKILVMTMMPEDQFAKRTLKAGASGYITKDSAVDEIINAIRKISSGRKYISQTLAEKLAEDLEENKADKEPLELLSDREMLILKLISTGKSQTDIARDLNLSVSTVNTYRSRILEKLDLKSTADLIRFAIQHNINEYNS
ncbi:two component transcriptional regulator, LuxR family [Melioribacter roseus P3M-2]|uniref:Two component transcriptional regulator, LuxR family n=1 Tax=Melioribacter roseus (strain DSM 23840 / JCM 17771 / VKM B-2668 / P3M-2) TaxID=1191523 RepID=I7A3M1_MELRP|nr:two component transcriptional regulator, LuxR family [Melioribacter roseus P3M-2]